jgi:hypothetical protein
MFQGQDVEVELLAAKGSSNRLARDFLNGLF